MNLALHTRDEAAKAAAGSVPTAVLAGMEALVCKDGVMLGGLSHSKRSLCLGMAAQSMPLDAEFNEAQANQFLKRALHEELVFVDIDHVELRRWLVDSGFWHRDGFGRTYWRVSQAQLRPELLELAQALHALDLAPWVKAQREAKAQARAARRADWERAPRG